MLPSANSIEHRRLPLHGPSPRRSCPRLVLSFYELFIWYDDSLRRKPELSTGDFHPTRSRPCWAYCTRRTAQGDYKWKINSPSPVTAAVTHPKNECVRSLTPPTFKRRSTTTSRCLHGRRGLNRVIDHAECGSRQFKTSHNQKTTSTSILPTPT